MSKENVDDLIMAGAGAYNERRFTRGGRLFLLALKEAKKKQICDVRLVFILNNLAYFYFVQNKLRKSQIVLGRALSWCERLLGRDHEYLVPILDGLADLSWRSCEIDRAEAYYNRSLQIARKENGSMNGGIADKLMRLARVCFAQARFDEAYRHLMEALDIKIHCLRSAGAIVAADILDFAPPDQAGAAEHCGDEVSVAHSEYSPVESPVGGLHSAAAGFQQGN